MKELNSMKYLVCIPALLFFIEANVLAKPKHFNSGKGLKNAYTFSDLKITKHPRKSQQSNSLNKTNRQFGEGT